MKKDKDKVVIWGLGNLFKKNESFLKQKYEITAVIDNGKAGERYEDFIILDSKNLEYNNELIIIMIENIQICFEIAHKLHYKMKIPVEKIILGVGLVPVGGVLEKGVENIAYSSDGRMIVGIKGFFCSISSLDEFNNITEVLIDEVYHYCINNDSRDIVIDVGMNIGDSAYYFLQQPKVRKVYAYEPFEHTYENGIKNLSDFINEKERLECFNYGLSNKTETREISYNPNMSCGMSTIENLNDRAVQNYEEWGLIEKRDSVHQKIEVYQASEILGPIIERHKKDNKVLKMDCEGEEYGIIDDLAINCLLKEFDIIMLEWHYNGKQSILSALKKDGFSYFSINESAQTGLIYAFR